MALPHNRTPDHLFFEIIAQIAEGKSVKELTTGPDAIMGRRTFFDRVERDAAVERAYRLAQQRSADSYLEKIDDVMAKVEAGEMDARAARTIINHLEWRAERANPQRYGQRVTNEHVEGKASYVDALQAAQPKIAEQAKQRAGNVVTIGRGGSGGSGITPIKKAEQA